MSDVSLLLILLLVNILRAQEDVEKRVNQTKTFFYMLHEI